MFASNYEIARDCINGACATGEEACAPVCAQQNSTVGTADAGPCSSDPDGGDPGVTACMPLPEGGPCPTNFGVVLQDFLNLNCPNGWEPYEIISGPTAAPMMGQCCYTVHQLLCTAGGRPYVVDRQARTAVAKQGAGWSEGDVPCLSGLSVEERADLAEAWTRDALAEHASIASFARFSLDLMASCAPAALVEEAHRAAIDEVRHAKLCFALATAYGGEEVAPGPFPVAPHSGFSTDASASLLALAVATATEGCVDETIYATLAAERALRATDRVVRAALETIADDEARHAELAWKTLAWAVRAGGDEVRDAVERAIEVRIADVRAARRLAPPRSAGRDAREQHGLLSPRDAALAADAAIVDVLLPATAALLRSRGSTSTSSATVADDAA
jgi:hypothetical protein